MFADPTVLTIDAAPVSLNKLTATSAGSKFATSDNKFRMEINHSNGRRVRHQMKLSHDTIVANPLITGNNIANSVSVYIVVDHPVGYDLAALKKDVDGFVAELAESSGAAVTKLLGGES